MNKVFLIGNVTRDVEQFSTKSGTGMCRFTVATDRKGKEKVTDFHSVIGFGKPAEICVKYLHKGDRVAVVGELQYSQYERDGQKRTSTAIVIDNVEFLGGKEPSKDRDDLQGFEDFNEPLPF